MTSRTSLREALRNYQTPFKEEERFIKPFLKLLESPGCFEKTHLPGHITGSAWIINQHRTRVLLLNHAKLKKWLQPGGHCDGEENVLNVALREVNEETGLTHPKVLEPACFDIDIHAIPQIRDFPPHDHYDVRFLMQVDDSTPLMISNESTDMQWIDFNDLENYSLERSILRLREKVMNG